MKGRFTLTMIKPDAVQNNHTGSILGKIEAAGFRISAMKYLQMTHEQAKEFYRVHEGRDFYNGLTAFMSSGPIVAAILERENAVEEYRKIIGATDPQKAEQGTLRNLFGSSIQNNGLHGSDSDENAQIESDFFFNKLERF